MNIKLYLKKAYLNLFQRVIIISIICIFISLMFSIFISFSYGQSNNQLSQLTKLLTHRDYRVRVQAAFSLGRLNDKRAISPLVGALSDPHPAVRAAVVDSLSKCNDQRVVNILEKHVDSSAVVKEHIDKALIILNRSKEHKIEKNDWNKAYFYIAVGDISSKDPNSAKLSSYLKDLLVKQLSSIPRVIAEPRDNQTNIQSILKKIKRYNLQGLQLQGSITKFIKISTKRIISLESHVSLFIFDIKTSSLCILLNGKGSSIEKLSKYNNQILFDMQRESLLLSVNSTAIKLTNTLLTKKLGVCSQKRE